MRNYKNIVTNVFGLILWLLAIYGVFKEFGVEYIIVLFLFGAIFFLIGNRALKSILKKVFVLRFSNTSNNTEINNEDYEQLD